MKSKLIFTLVLILLQLQFEALSQTYIVSMTPKGESACGYINLNGEIIAEAQYTVCHKFSTDGIALISNKKFTKFIFIDRNGKEIVPETKLKIQVGDWSGIPSLYVGGILLIKEKGKWGGLDGKGQLAVPAIYDELTEFSNGYAMGKRDKTYFVVDKNGREKAIQGEDIIYIKHFSDDLAPIEVKGQIWGFVDTSGLVAIKPQHKGVGYFSGGFAWARTKSNNIGFIDKKGEWAVEPQFAVVQNTDAVSGIALAKKRSAELEYSYVDMDGNYTSFEMADNSYGFSDGLALAKLGGKFGYLDKNGEWAIKPEFDQARHFVNGFAAVKKDGNWGIIDKSGQFVLQPAYKELGDVAVIY
jgi:hypothetical protein